MSRPAQPAPICEAIGWNIDCARKEAGLSQAQLAGMLGVSVNTLKSWLERFTGNVDNLCDIHQELGIPLWGLVPTPEEARELMEDEG